MTTADDLLDDIIHRLHNICRFNGAVKARDCDRGYSVLEHTTAGLYLMRQEQEPLEDRIGYAVHDFAEAFVGDVISPIKNHPSIKTAFAAIENTEHARICAALGVDRNLSRSPNVKRYDLIMVAAEIYEVATITDGKHPYIHAAHGKAAELVSTGVCNGKDAFMNEWQLLWENDNG